MCYPSPLLKLKEKKATKRYADCNEFLHNYGKHGKFYLCTFVCLFIVSWGFKTKFCCCNLPEDLRRPVMSNNGSIVKIWKCWQFDALHWFLSPQQHSFRTVQSKLTFLYWWEAIHTQQLWLGKLQTKKNFINGNIKPYSKHSFPLTKFWVQSTEIANETGLKLEKL